jgi:hypothetical protein
MGALIGLGFNLRNLAEATGNIALLQEAVQAADEALMAVPAGSPLRPGGHRYDGRRLAAARRAVA